MLHYLQKSKLTNMFVFSYKNKKVPLLLFKFKLLLLQYFSAQFFTFCPKSCGVIQSLCGSAATNQFPSELLCKHVSLLLSRVGLSDLCTVYGPAAAAAPGNGYFSLFNLQLVHQTPVWHFRNRTAFLSAAA